MHITNVLRKPILTEKSYRAMSNNVFTFEVDRRANRTHVKKAFETIFEVKVANVNIINSKPKDKKVGKYLGKTSHVKKAIIKLKEGETLDLLGENKK